QVSTSTIGTLSRLQIVTGKALPVNEPACRDPVARLATPIWSKTALRANEPARRPSARSAVRRLASVVRAGRDSPRTRTCATTSKASARPGDHVKVQRGVRERSIERDESERPRETESGGHDRQGCTEEPDPHSGALNAAAPERSARDRVLPNEGNDERDTRDA